MVKLLLTALAVAVPFTPVHQVHDDFSTFETSSYFNDAFGDLEGYYLNLDDYNVITGYEIDNTGSEYIYFGFPIYYDITFNPNVSLHYSNDYFNFYLVGDYVYSFIIDNYSGVDAVLAFGMLDANAMTTYIDNEPKPSMTEGIIGTISEWVTGSIGILVAGLTSFVSVFYNSTTSEVTAIGILALLGLAVGLVTLIIAFVRRLFDR